MIDVVKKAGDVEGLSHAWRHVDNVVERGVCEVDIGFSKRTVSADLSSHRLVAIDSLQAINEHASVVREDVRIKVGGVGDWARLRDDLTLFSAIFRNGRHVRDEWKERVPGNFLT